ncbi:MAG: site-specific integrase, partial [Acetatifactor sp.]|nr:site-specific integrase [Acetatifactor sp.]
MKICCYAKDSYRFGFTENGMTLHTRSTPMEEQIEQFITYLLQIKELSGNTVLSYQRDLRQFRQYM